MTRPVTVAEPPRCPYCGEDRLVEVDARRRTAVCLVCSGMWTPPEPEGR
jgi:hypothetical protein